jgi:hypothetical protein
MKKRAIAIVLLLLVCLAGPVFAQGDNPRLAALKKYILEKDYPEVFKNSPYKSRIEGFVDADLDNDGSNEIVVLFNPHYRQSAPILIYKVSPEMKVQRVTEGLAPGPSQKVSGDYLDSHSLGEAADFEIQPGKATPEEIFAVMSRS